MVSLSPPPATRCLITNDFRTLSSLNAEEAKRVARYTGRTLRLDGLQTLERDSAWELARYRGALLLNGITTLSADAAKALSLHEGGCLSFNGLTYLPPDAADALSPFKNQLLLNGLSQISDETCQALARRACGLSLNGLKHLSAMAARSLAQPDGWPLSLPRAAPLPESVRRQLSRIKGKPLSLDGISELSSEAEKALSLHTGPLSLAKITALKTSSLAARLMCETKGETAVSIKDLTVDAIAGVAGYVNPDEHEWIHDVILVFDHVQELSPEMAQALSRFNGHSICLNGVSQLSDNVARALRTYEVWQLSLNGLTSLTEKCAGGMASQTGWLFMSGLKTVDTAVAKALAQRKGKVSLSGLESLTDPDLARKLAEDTELELPRLLHLSDEAAEALAVAGTYVSLPRLPLLSLRSAQAFAKGFGGIKLQGLGELSDECAAALAGFKGSELDLGYVKILSARAEATLRRNPNIYLLNAEQHAENVEFSVRLKAMLVALPHKQDKGNP